MGVSAEEGRSLLVAAFEGIRVSLGSVLDIVASPDQTAAARGAA